MEERLPFGSELITRIGWLIKLRWLAVVGTAMAIGLMVMWFPDSMVFGALLGIVGAIAIYNFVFLFLLQSLQNVSIPQDRNRRAFKVAFGQIILDLVALAAIVHYSGGIENPMVIFFVFHAIIASILLQSGISYLVAGLAALLLATMTVLEGAGIWPHYHLPILRIELYEESSYLLVFVGGMALALFLTAYLTTAIAARLRQRDQALVESNWTCEIRSQELEELNEKLRRVDEERTRFMVLVTHELRAPVNTIYSALDLALSGYASPEKSRDVLERAQNRAIELLDLIRDLLDLTRVREQSVRRDQVVPIQIADVLQEVAAFVRVEAEGKNISLALEIEPELPAVRVLPEQIKLVWTNLLSNAIKYTQPGGRVWITLRRDGDQVRGAVHDTGIGISPEDMNQVFGEFFRAANARQVSPHGTGVGLAVVERTIQYWGGRIWAESEIGQGSTFVFVLPQADA